jgi:serine/threonine protein kinase
MRRQSDKKFVLIDFGGVKEVFNNNSVNQSSPNLLTQISTTGYTPQEQVNGYPEFNSDIYALGMTAIRALTGIEPRELERNQKNKSVNWKESGIKVSPRLSNVIDKMIQENSEDRYQRVEEVLSDLSATEQTLIVARPTPNTQVTFINSIIQTRIPRTNIPLGLIFVCLVPFVAIGGFIFGFKIFYQPNVPPTLPPGTYDSQNSPSPQIPQKNPSTSATENPSMQDSPSPQTSSEPSPKTMENSDNENGLFKRPDSLK